MSGLDTRGIELEQLAQEPCPRVKQEFRVFLGEKAFDRAVARGHESPDREIGGILVGDVRRDEAGPYVRVDTTIDALHADEQGTELTFTHATWEHVHAEMDDKHQGKKIVGWYHTHPGFGIFLSDRDQFIHRSFFNLPFQIALVYDPRSREHGVFVWRDNEPRRSRRHWVGEREHIWDGAPPARAPEAAVPGGKESGAMGTEEEGKDAEASERSADWLGLALTGAVLLFLGGFLGWWLGGRGAADELAQGRRQLEAQGALAAQQTLRALQLELLGLLRNAVGSEAVRGPVDDAVARLDRSLAALEGAGAPESAVTEIKAARRRLLALRDDSARAEKTLRSLADVQRDAVDPREIRRLLSRQAAILGQICVEVAATTPDKRAARRLLRNAMAIDPGNTRIYEKKLQELEK